MEMENVLVYRESLQNIADAIRLKTGGTETYKPGEMAEAIRKLLIEEGTLTYETLEELQAVVGTEGDLAVVHNGTDFDGAYEYTGGTWVEIFSARRYDDTLTPEDYQTAVANAENILSGSSGTYNPEKGTVPYSSLEELQAVEGEENEIAVVVSPSTGYDGTYQWDGTQWVEIFSSRRYEGTLTPENYQEALAISQSVKGDAE